jgi:hypothetical protein
MIQSERRFRLKPNIEAVPKTAFGCHLFFGLDDSRKVSPLKVKLN